MNKVHAIKDGEKLFEIQEALQKENGATWRRRFLLFMVGIHTGLRISDLVRLKVKHVSGPEIETIEKKTGKRSVLPLSPLIRLVLQDRLQGMAPDDYLFPSRIHNPDGSEKSITTRNAYDDMQTIAERFNLRGPVGCHTLRKTFGYWHYQNNHDLELLRQWFNHANTAVTLRYIEMDVEERRKSVIGHNPGKFQYEPEKPVNRGRPRSTSEPLEVINLDRAEQGAHRAKVMRQKRKDGAHGKKK